MTDPTGIAWNFTDAQGRCFLAGTPVHPDAYAEFQAVCDERDRLTDGIRELWEVWMDDDASWVEVAGTLDELHTSLDVAGDDREGGQ